MTDDSLNQPPEWAREIRVRATISLEGLAYGETATVNQTDPTIREFLENGYLIRIGNEEE